jgi:hypothetical protein
MAKGDSTGPKRGAFPTPRNILADAKPFKPPKPDKSAPGGGRPTEGSDSQEEFREQQNRGGKKDP